MYIKRTRQKYKNNIRRELGKAAREAIITSQSCFGLPCSIMVPKGASRYNIKKRDKYLVYAYIWRFLGDF